MTPDAPPRSRKRAVHLSEDARERLRAALLDKLRAEAPDRRLTRELKAEWLGLSTVTVERILRGERVDRATLEVAFSRLGVALSPADYSVEAPSEPVVVPQPVPPPAPSAPGPHRTGLRRLAFGAAALPLIVAGAGWLLPDREPGPSPHRSLGLSREINLGEAAFHRARYADARTKADRALANARKQDLAGGLAEALRLSADVATAMGDLPRAREEYRRSIRIRESMAQTEVLPSLSGALGEVERRMGLRTAAGESLRRSLAGFRRAGDEVGVALALRDIGQLRFDGGDWKAARQAYRESLAALGWATKPEIRMDLKARAAVAVAYDGHRFADARADLTACLDYWRANDHPRWMATTEFQLGLVERAAGEPARAAAHFEASRTGYAAVGDSLGVRDAHRQLLVRR